ncbi:MAG TPA: hypothetical protein VL026_03795, partial [Rhizomicrobium sp.]|nr:hypothetical protein [Rhizomicrobium sp.]
VVTPIRSTAAKPASWKDAKAFARDICLAVEATEPARYTTNMAKAKRGGKIFLDYLRNDRTSTAVAPWSPRARAHAPLAVPLSWAQVKRGLDPQSFTLPKAAALLRRADPWKDFFQSALLLSAARKRFDAR